MTRQRIQTFSLLLIAVGMLPVGVQAAFAPRSFFNDFPLGRGWIAQDGGAYNEHLVRDVGVLFLALIIVTAWTALRQRPARPIAVAWLVQGVLHALYHAHHLDGYKTVDKVGMIGSLALVPVLALIALWAGRPTSAESA